MIETKTKINRVARARLVTEVRSSTVRSGKGLKNIDSRIGVGYATKAEVVAIERAKKEFARGEYITLEDFKKKYNR